jgi:hypothetical protein
MRLEDYTADAICQAMGLPSFIEDSWAQAESPTLRVVLTPSFHPELCVTLSRTADAVRLSVVALTEQFWSQRSGVYLPTEREEVHLALRDFDEALALFATAHANFDSLRRYVCIDGMGSESCLVSRTGTQRLDAHVSAHRPSGQLVERLIELAWNACRQPRVRNALSQAARYLSVEYPLEEVPPQPAITRLAVLGTPEARHDYFEMLRQSKKDEG